MKVDLSLDVSGVQSVLKLARESLNPATLDGIQLATGRVVGARVEQYLREYPPAPNRPLTPRYTRTRYNADGEAVGSYLSKFKTAKQQGYYFGVIVKGGKTPYKRTGRLGRSVFSRATLEGGVLLVTVGVATPYARYVVGDLQYYYHRDTGWVKIEQMLQENENSIKLLFEDTFMQLFIRKFRGK